MPEIAFECFWGTAHSKKFSGWLSSGVWSKEPFSFLGAAERFLLGACRASFLGTCLYRSKEPSEWLPAILLKRTLCTARSAGKSHVATVVGAEIPKWMQGECTGGMARERHFGIATEPVPLVDTPEVKSQVWCHSDYDAQQSCAELVNVCQLAMLPSLAQVDPWSSANF